MNPTTQNRRTLNKRTAHFPFCFPSFGLSLMKEEVTMVIEDTAYLELCNAFFFFFFECETHSQQGREEADFILQAMRKQENVQIFTYTYLHTRKQMEPWGRI